MRPRELAAELNSRGPRLPPAAPHPSRTSADSQGVFWKSVFAFKDTLVKKLRSCGREDLIGRMELCHTEELALTCKGCCRVKIVSERCEKRWCPICVPRLTRERQEQLIWWINQLRQPKHVVLTCRNTKTLTKQKVRSFTSALRRLRSQKFCREWKSGVWSLEVTNESRGWHLHSHLLVEARWIDSAQLAKIWGKLVGQDFAIVKVKDARKADYLRELCKYVVKSNQLAAWDPLDIAAFMDAMTGTRSFGVFGSLVGQRSKWKQFLRSLRSERGNCECGCREFHVQDARIWQLGHEGRMKLQALQKKSYATNHL